MNLNSISNYITSNISVENYRGIICELIQYNINSHIIEWSYKPYLVDSDDNIHEISDSSLLLIIDNEMKSRKQFLLGISLKYKNELTDDFITYNVDTKIGDEFPFGLNGIITIGYNKKWKKYYIMQSKNLGIYINITHGYNILDVLDLTTNVKIIEGKNSIMNELTDEEKKIIIQNNDYITLKDIEKNNNNFIYEYNLVKNI
jgi:hypothetical protein